MAEPQPATDGAEIAEDWDEAFTVEGKPVVEPRYADVETFVAEHFAPLIRRQLGGAYTWCPQWWLHPEALSRLEALWRAWEVLRLEPGLGMSVWWRDHADMQLPILMSRDAGPFAACRPDRHSDELTGLPHDVGPAVSTPETSAG